MDKFVVNVSKRKKRRTRRNLDEIRKRTLKLHSNDEVIPYQEVKPTITNYMTSSRLTLMKKAIRSETMTRSLLSKLRQEKNNADVLMSSKAENKKVSNTPLNKESVYIDKKLKSSSINYSKIEEHRTQGSINLFSSSDSEKVADSMNGVLSDCSSSPSVTLHNMSQRDNSLYDEFMNNIENYIQEVASDFLKPDYICKYKDIFRNDCIENKLNIQSKESDKAQTKCNINTNLFVIDSDDNISQNSYELSLEELVPRHMYHTTPTVSLPSSSSDCRSPVPDSPEYLYYPHKLNQ